MFDNVSCLKAMKNTVIKQIINQTIAAFLLINKLAERGIKVNHGSIAEYIIPDL
jgi:hypothetical protein